MTTHAASGSGRTGIVLAILVVVGLAVAAALFVRSRSSVPSPGSEIYEQVTRAFYRGLAQLEVGLLDDATGEFTTVTTLVPEEPAGWANLGLTHLRLGELDEAAAPVAQAIVLAPDNADLALLAARMELARGNVDEGITELRRAVELAPSSLQARFALAEEVERSGAADADAQALALLDELVKLAPRNMAVLVDRARVAAKAGDAARLRDALDRLQPMAAGWPEIAVEQYRDLEAAVAANDFAMAQRATAFLRNVLARVPAFGEDLAAVRTSLELIGEPVPRFLAMAPPSPMPAAPDRALSFTREPVAHRLTGPVPFLVVTPAVDDQPPQIFAADTASLQSLTAPETRLAIPPPDGPGGGMSSVVIADWNNDFRHDIVSAGAGGVRVFVQQETGSFVDQTPEGDARAAACACTGVWAADVEMDGDIDLIASDGSGPPFVLRNNGDGSWTSIDMFGDVRGAVDLAWADLDNDGDPDAVFRTVVDGVSRLHAFANRQAGDFARMADVPAADPLTMTIGDLNGDGVFEVVVLERSGAIRALTWGNGEWAPRAVASWPGFDSAATSARLIVADFDNNGALDLIGTTSGTRPRLWLGDESRELQLVDALAMEGQLFSAGDLNGDGLVDLVGLALDGGTGNQVVRLLNNGAAGYHWKRIHPRAQATAGDQRINSFGTGGYIEVRSGLLFQKQPLTGGPVHIGLGTHTAIDVARIMWPNGNAQAEFGVDVDSGMVAEQRLKGSCPWVFTWDGSRMVFVTDFLWRSPLGLRINAQDTAGVTQTEDWVKLRADQLVPRNGVYDVRITAELWETHYFDHVSLIAVDHPEGTEVFVDERFSAASPPDLKIHAVTSLRPVARAWDHRGAEVTGVVSRRDGQYLATFARGRYQGIAEEHFVEFETRGAGANDVLVANGWIYPTDSSINMAAAQAGIAPRGLSLEAQNADGSWRVIDADLGFPAGKNKTVVIDLGRAAGAPRLRLRTNLEIYWDVLQVGTRDSSAIRTTRLDVTTAELRYRGFSRTTSPRGDTPETPDYDRIDSTSPRWRDLEGYHTRFGDVRELIGQVDDRYVIMNAGDELRLEFPEQAAPPAGWARDFVLIGDGWEKDGDYNTGFSSTVLPLPSHDRPDYGAGTTSLVLEDDPVYQRHRGDWERFHTRYVTPRRFLGSLHPRTN